MKCKITQRVAFPCAVLLMSLAGCGANTPPIPYPVDDYRTGGYFYRSAGAISGGPESIATSEAVWFLRVHGSEQTEALPDCVEVPL